MNRINIWRRNFNPRMFLVRILVNMLALFVTALLLRGVYVVDKRIVILLGLALALSFLNAVVKPVVAFLTLRFIFATGGLVLAVINGLVLWFLTLLFPTWLQINGIFAALLGGLVLGLVSALLEALLGLNSPIVSEKYPEIREKIKDRQFYRTRMVPARMAAKSMPSEGELEAGIETEPASLPALTHTTSGTLAQVPPAVDDNKTSLPSTATEPEA